MDVPRPPTPVQIAVEVGGAIFVGGIGMTLLLAVLQSLTEKRRK
jgi:hypothetical protein